MQVTLSGQDRWRDVQGLVPVQIRYAALPPLEPSELFFSDDPEKVQGNQAGVLFRQALPAQTTVRLFAYAELEAPGQSLHLLMRSQGTSHVQVLGDTAGPGFSDDVGHKASVRYLGARRTQQSVVDTVTAGDPDVIEIGQPASATATVVSGIFDLRLIDGDPTDVAVIAASPSDDPRSFGQDAQAGFEDSHFRAGVYPLFAEPPLMFSASVGVQFATPPNGTSVTVGTWAVPPIVGKRYLIGDYGVVRSLRITLTNVSASAGTLYFYEMPSTHGVTTTVFFDGEVAPVELPCLRAPKETPARYLIRKFTVPPGGSPLVVTGEYMTDGGSEYPVEIGLSAAPPLDPPVKGNCW